MISQSVPKLTIIAGPNGSQFESLPEWLIMSVPQEQLQSFRAERNRS